ncbi:MAG TPA: DUF429 domain-containing protein [Acidimicrobiales bacterium]|nr:MAG: hypothetical protein B7Z69_01865 [Actinobacteria bacterium 21-73-9]HQU26296.1 DUF429 domain-containing protein [Acidimicrobiales bacterium]
MAPGTSAPRRVLGVDLATEPARTGLVEGEWRAGAWRLTGPYPGDDGSILERAAGAAVGLDAPLGWPDAFVEAVGAHHAQRPWPDGVDPVDLRYRATDRFVVGLELGVRPLSVSSDLIGAVAWRAAGLMEGLARAGGRPLTRDGRDGVYEVYPAAALRAWGLLARRGERYKGGRVADPGPRALRERIVGALAEGAVGPLELGGGLAGAAVDSDHVLDAILGALVVTAALAGATIPPPAALAERASREGWIHVPVVRP